MLIKGLLHQMSQSSILPMFKNMGVDAADLQIFTTIAVSPWSLKPVIGVISDLVAIRGYHKRYWLIQSVIVGLGSASLMFFTSTWPFILVLCFAGLNYEMSIVDLLTEGKYAEKIQRYPESSSDVITFVQGLQTLGSIIAISFIGQVADTKQFWILFIIATVVSFIPFIPSMLGWLPEEKASDLFIFIEKNLFKRNRAIFIVVGFTGLAGPVVAFLATYTNRLVGLICSLLLLGGAVGGSYMAFTPIIANIGLYQVLARLSKPSMGTALDYFYTAPEVCVAGGPDFTFKYFITYTGLASACVRMAGVWIYQSVLSKWRFRTVLIFTTCLIGIGGCSDLIMVLRLNRMIGIPDRAFYFFGEAVFESIVDMLYYIPSTIIIAKVCPRNLESATYAFLAGISNFSFMVAELSGAVIFEAAGIKSCNFDALWWLVLTFHIILPIAVGIPISWLIPNITQTEIVLEDETEDIELFFIEESSDVELDDC